MKSEILTPGQLETIEVAMRNGTATQQDGVRLCNSHRALQRELDRIDEFLDTCPFVTIVNG